MKSDNSDKMKHEGNLLRIGKHESAFLSILRRHSLAIVFAVATILGAAIRLIGLDFISYDAEKFLLPWHEKIAAGGVWSLGTQVGNYGMPYQLLIMLGTFLPMPGLYWYKFTSILFDFLLALQAYSLVKLITKSRTLSTVAYCAIFVLALPFALNSSVWGQCDSVYVFFIAASLTCLFKEKPGAAYFLLGVALSFKLQALFIVPFFIYHYITQQNYSLIVVLWTIAGFYLLSIPGIIAGRSVLDPLRIYLSQAGLYKSMYMNYPSFWVLIGNSFETLEIPAIILTLMIIFMGFLVKATPKENVRPRASATSYLLFATWIAWTCVEFLPAMHERYGYLAMFLLIICLLSCSLRMRPIITICLATLVIIDCLTYGSYLFGQEIPLLFMSIACLGAWTAFTYSLIKYDSILSGSSERQNDDEQN